MVVTFGARTGQVVVFGARTGQVVVFEARTGHLVVFGARTGQVVVFGARPGQVVVFEAGTGGVSVVGRLSCDVGCFRRILCHQCVPVGRRRSGGSGPGRLGSPRRLTAATCRALLSSWGGGGRLRVAVTGVRGNGMPTVGQEPDGSAGRKFTTVA